MFLHEYECIMHPSLHPATWMSRVVVSFTPQHNVVSLKV